MIDSIDWLILNTSLLLIITVGTAYLRFHERKGTLQLFSILMSTISGLARVFRLINAPMSFQRTVDSISSRFRGKSYLIYLNSVIIISKSMKQHLKHERKLLYTQRTASFLFIEENTSTWARNSKTLVTSTDFEKQ